VTVHVVVVAFGAPDDLAACLAALDGRFPVTVVDNSSQAACRAVAEAAGAEYVDPERNLGFAAGVNRGINAAGRPASDILLLNPDARIDAVAVEQLHERLRSGRRLAGVAPALVDATGEWQRVCWPFPTPAGMWVEAVGLGRCRRRCDFLVGSVLLLRAEALAEVGAFDERFFLYAEEADWQRRARALGWEFECCGDVLAYHRGAGTSTDPVLRQARFHCAHETYIRKWYGRSGWQLYRAAALIGAVLRSIRLDKAAKNDARSRARLYLHGPCSALHR
jgi:GT2 family glycosyltransferase